jgi:deoxyadenosine/deoxycytidine kinase
MHAQTHTHIDIMRIYFPQNNYIKMANEMLNTTAQRSVFHLQLIQIDPNFAKHRTFALYMNIRSGARHLLKYQTQFPHTMIILKCA